MDELSELKLQVAQLREELTSLKTPSEYKPSLWQRFKFKLSEKGSQQGVLAIIPLLATQFHIPTESLVAIFAFVLGIAGIHNFILEG
jgi:hypothetical protein